MFGFTWLLGIFFLIIMTLLRHILLRNSAQEQKFIRIFSLSSQVVGVEAVILMGQIIGVTWIILGIVLDKFLRVSDGPVKDFLELMVFYGPIVFFSWLLTSKIRNQKKG